MLGRVRKMFKGDGLGAKLMRAFAGSAGLRIAGMALGFLVGVQLARGLGASGYGVYGLAMSVISLVSSPAEFGLPQLITREVAASQVRGKWEIIWAALRWARCTVLNLSIGIAAVGTLVWIQVGHYIENDLTYALFSGALLIPLVPLGNIYSATLRGLQQIIKGQISEILLRPALFSCLLLVATVFLPNGLTPATAMVMQCTAAAAALLASYLMLHNLMPQDTEARATEAQRRSWFRSAFPMALTESMRLLHGNIAILILGLLSTNAVAGIFRVGSSMGLILTMPMAVIHIVSAPVFARLHASNDTSKLQRLVSSTTVAMTTGGILITLPFLIAGDHIIDLLFGEEFHGANTVLLILGLGTVVGSAFGPGAALLNMTGHENRVTRSLALNLLLVGLLIYPLTATWGASGAALATSIAYIGWNFLMWNYAKNTLNIDTSMLNFPNTLRHILQK